MEKKIKIEVDALSFRYGKTPVLKNVSARFSENAITAIVGPSGCGKSTFLKVLNRLWEGFPGAERSGCVRIRFDDVFQDIYDPAFSLPRLRRKVGMVFQTPNPLPMSIYKNVAFPLKLMGENKKHLSPRVEQALRDAYLWEEVKDRLTLDARHLSGGQQQRLCIARALILEPEVLLLDEPTASLDAEAGEIIESLLVNLKSHCSLVIVSHYMDQVKRIADECIRITEAGFSGLNTGI